MERRMGLVDGLEKLTVGSALFEAAYRSRGIEPMPQFDRNRLPQLSEALRANHLDGEALFIATVRQYLDGFASVAPKAPADRAKRSEEHTSELQSLMRISYAVFCLKKKKIKE